MSHRAYNREWMRRARADGRVMDNPETKARAQAKYRRKGRVKAAHAARQARLYRDPAHSPRIMARAALRNAIQLGHLQRGACRDCGSGKTEGHHTDYAKPLDVVWLCRRCHLREHKRQRGQDFRPCGMCAHSTCTLHAAAPDLLAALANILEHKVPAPVEVLERLTSAARAAVNKARGLHA